MIESTFPYSSSWDSQSIQDFTEVSYTELDDCLQDFERNCPSFSTFNDLSNSSSLYDDLVFDDFDKILPVADSLISHVLEESSSIGFEDNWSLVDDTHGYPLSIESDSISARESPKKVKKSLNYFSHKLWSKMSSEEQLETLHTLSEIVTCHMGIREQMEIIKIIDPSATISPDDKEFALDISCLNDTKMKRIQEFVKKHKFCFSKFSKKLSNPQTKSFVSKKATQLSNVLAKKTNSRSKRKQKHRTLIDEDIRQKRKLELHGRKEIRSGLFVYEKVIKKLSDPSEEDEDVNILE